MAEANVEEHSQNSNMEDIDIEDDGTIIHRGLNIIRALSNHGNIVNRALTVGEDVKAALILTTKMCALLKNRSLHSIWKIVSKFKPVEDSTLSRKEARRRIKDLALDIEDFYIEATPKWNQLLVYLETTPEPRWSRKSIQTVWTYIQYTVSEMVDLDQKLSILNHLLRSTTPNITHRVNIFDQLLCITNRASLLKSKFKLKTAGKKEIESFARLTRRMYVFLDELDLTKMSDTQQERYNQIKRWLELGERNTAQLTKIVYLFETVKDDVKEHISMCKMKCRKYDSMFKLHKENYRNNYCCKEVNSFIIHISKFFHDIVRECHILNGRIFLIKQIMLFID